MRGLTRRWQLRDPVSPTASVSRAASLSGLRLPPLVERILLARGLSDPEKVQQFCDPRLTDLHDPSLLPGVDAAAERLVDAVRRGSAIVIYGDYDVDGITATAILHHLITAAAPGANLKTYVPHRLEEGYGLSAEALRQIRADGAEVVVSVDCGITAVEPARVAREVGLELIVTDHHALPPGGGPLPDALLVHPRLPGSAYPFGELCGAGVAFKLAWGFATCWCGSPRVSERLQKTLLAMLPLAALGTIADVVPLVGENRIIATYGLRLIKATPITGLRALIEASGLMDARIDCEKVGFVLAPRLNACGRMGSAAEAVRLLTDAAPDEAAAIARRLAEQNRARQSTERLIAEQAARMAEEAGMTGVAKRAIVLADPAWHPGVVGIVCSRLVDLFGRPAVLLQDQGDVCRGSARSIEGYSIHDALAATAPLLQSFGGHEAAAGVVLASENLDAFVEALIAHANAHIEPERLVPAVTIDCDAALHEIDLATVKRIRAMSPFGQANRRPTVRVQGAILDGPPTPMGGQGRHLALRLRAEGDESGRGLRGVWWRNGARADELAAGMRLDVVIEPKLNEWMGRQRVEAEVYDVRVAEGEGTQGQRD